MKFISQYPWWMFVLCLLLGALYAFLLYRKDKKLSEFSLPLIRLLAVLRTILVTLLAALLMAPLVSYSSRKVDPPKILIAIDNSASMVMNQDSSFYQEELNGLIEKLSNELDGEYTVSKYFFDENVTSDGAPNFQGKITDFDPLFDRIEERYLNQNLGAIVLVSDGIYNQGGNPIYRAEKDMAPIYVIAAGDSTIRKDLKIQAIRQNEIAYLDNQFPVEIDVLANKVKGANSELKIFKNGKELFSKSLEFNSDQALQTIQTNLEAEKVGIQKYDVVLSAIDGEVSELNNRQSFYIDVLDGRQKILMLAHAPHPDLAAIKNALSKNKNYEVKTILAQDFQGNLGDYNLVIFHQLPSIKYPIGPWLSQANSDFASWYILGESTDILAYNGLEASLQFNPQGKEVNQVLAAYESAFPLFTLSEMQEKQLKQYPPLQVPFGDYQLNGQAYPLFKQKIGSVSTNSPLLAFREEEGKKTATLIGEGIWRWRLANYQSAKNHQSFDELVSKIVQFLAVKADKSYFRIEHAKSYLENETIAFEVQLYNQAYELINEAEVKITLKDESEKEFPYTFSRSKNAYFLNISNLAVGEYSYVAETAYGGKSFQEVGEFSVKAIQLEEAQLRANHNLLFQLAEQSNGELLYPKDLQSLTEKIKNRTDIASIRYQEEQIEEVIKLKWIFFVLLGLLSLEWFLRKRNGAY